MYICWTVPASVLNQTPTTNCSVSNCLLPNDSTNNHFDIFQVGHNTRTLKAKVHKHCQLVGETSIMTTCRSRVHGPTQSAPYYRLPYIFSGYLPIWNSLWLVWRCVTWCLRCWWWENRTGIDSKDIDKVWLIYTGLDINSREVFMTSLESKPKASGKGKVNRIVYKQCNEIPWTTIWKAGEW